MPPGIPTDLAAALDARYELGSVLGRGGMATVYLAYDHKNHRSVALKVLRPEIAASLGADRFLKEIEIAAQLTHPHILALYDSGEAAGGEGREAGYVYYVMPFMEGGCLRQVMDREGPMEAARALAIGTPVADALDYAHRMGVLHRDIKPENILFSQGHPIVADFGIAKALSAATTGNRTQTGLALGTPGYMSPEQAAGLRELDQRTDVYSLAVVIYEMITGGTAGVWPNEEAQRAGAFLNAPSGQRARLAAAGATVERALVHGLAIHSDQRTRTPAALIDELRATVVASPPKRRFGREEVDAIVKRASELELSRPAETGAMTIGAVEAIAGEAGIAPGLVRSAAAALDPASSGAVPAPIDPPRANMLIGGPTRLVFERIVDGELPEPEYPVVVDEIRRVLRNAGQVNQLGRSFSWTMGRQGTRREVEVVVSVRSGRTRITVQENLHRLIGATFGGIGGSLGVGGSSTILAVSIGALHLAPWWLGIVLPAWYTAVYVIARTSYHLSTERRQGELGPLADRLAELVRELIAEAKRLPPSR